MVGTNGESTTFPAAMQPFQPSETALPEPFYQYRADITGLTPGSSYSYGVLVDGQDLASGPSQYSFTYAGAGTIFVPLLR